jgi:hypothetical protein
MECDLNTPQQQQQQQQQQQMNDFFPAIGRSSHVQVI